MAKLNFFKMHDLGNDFIFIDSLTKEINLTKSQIQKLACRKKGIGGDQLIIMRHSPDYDAYMEIYNNNGEEVEACGNATRCLAYLLKLWHEKKECYIQTKAELIYCKWQQDRQFSVYYEPPYFGEKTVGFTGKPEDLAQLGTYYALVSIGNPHLVIFNEEELPWQKIEKYAKLLTESNQFKNGININFAKIEKDQVNLKVYERGSGYTGGCGTGACATAVAANKLGLINSNSIMLKQDGGKLRVDWLDNGKICLTGDANYIFEGTIEM